MGKAKASVVAAIEASMVLKKFACRCGASTCRGTMLEPPLPKPKAVRRGRLIK